VTHGKSDPPAVSTVHTIGRSSPVARHPPSSVGASLQSSGEPDGHDGSEQWDTMLTRLAIDRARHLLEDTIGTLEQLVPATDAPLDAALRHLRSALRRLGVQ
jgi:hypothetical protein